MVEVVPHHRDRAERLRRHPREHEAAQLGLRDGERQVADVDRRADEAVGGGAGVSHRCRASLRVASGCGLRLQVCLRQEELDPV